jgi:hypothetical protein
MHGSMFMAGKLSELTKQFTERMVNLSGLHIKIKEDQFEQNHIYGAISL